MKLALVFLVLALADLGLLAPAIFRGDLARAPGDELQRAMPYRREAEVEPPPPANPYLSDWCYSIHSWQRLVRAALREGHLPLWNDRAGCGQPLIGNMQAEIFSPYQPLNVIAGDQYIDWKQLAQLLVAQLSCLVLAAVLGLSAPAALVLATAYSFGSYMQAWMVHPVAGSAAFAPAIVACFLLLRRGFSYQRLASAGLVIGLSILSGHVETSFMACFAASGLGFLMTREGEGRGLRALIGRTRFAGLALAAGALGLALAAVTLLPFFDYYEQSLVAEVRRAQPARSVPAEHLLALLDAKALGFPTDAGGFRGFENYITTIIHIGRGALLLAFVGLGFGLLRRRRGVLPLALISAFGLALSHLPPESQKLVDFFPFNVMPLLRLHYLAALLLPALAGIGLDLLLAERRRRTALVVLGLGIALTLAGPLSVHFAGALSFAPHFSAAGLAIWTALTILLALAVADFGSRRELGQIALGLFLVLGLGESVLIWRPFVPVVATSNLSPRSEALDWLEQQEKPGRLLPIVPNLPPETASLHHVRSLRSYDGMGMTRLTALLLSLGSYQGVTTDAPIVSAPRGVLDALGVRWTLSDFDPERAVSRYVESFVRPGDRSDWDFTALTDAEIEFLVLRADRGPIPADALRIEFRDDEGRVIEHRLLEPEEQLQSVAGLGRFHRDRDPALAAFIRRGEDIQGSTHHHVAFRMSRSGVQVHGSLIIADDAPPMVVQVLGRDSWNSVSRFEHKGIHIGERRDAPAMVQVSARQLVVENLETAIKTIGQPGFDPRLATILECEPEFLADLQPEDARELPFTRPRPEEIHIKTSFERTTLVVVSEVFARGWEARADGKRLDLAPANVAAMAIRVPGGAHDVVLSYRSISLAWGTLVSGLALLLILGAPLADRIRSGKSAARDLPGRSSGEEAAR